MRCHQVDYEIVGDDLQMVEIELDPGESVFMARHRLLRG